MSYECKHVVRYRKDELNTMENMRKLNDAFGKACQFGEFVIAKDGSCLSDRNWNCGFGLTWYDQDYDMENVAKEIKEDLVVYTLDENQNEHWKFAYVETDYDEDGRYDYAEWTDNQEDYDRFMNLWNQTLEPNEEHDDNSTTDD